MNKFKIYFKSIMIPVLVGVVVGLVSSSARDYTTLIKPFLAPPGWLFPVMWTILYILMGISYGILETNRLTSKKIDSIYYIQLIVNALWSIIFFNLKLRLIAFIWIILLAVLVIIMIVRFYKENKAAGLLQIPYLLWVLFATYLNYSFYILNK